MERKRLAELLNRIFGWGVFCTLMAGALSFFGFFAALVIGGESGQEIALFIQRKYFPVIIRVTSIMVGIGLLALYVGKEHALSLLTDKREADMEIKSAKS